MAPCTVARGKSGEYMRDPPCGAATIYYSDLANARMELYVNATWIIQHNYAKVTLPSSLSKNTHVMVKKILFAREIAMR